MFKAATPVVPLPKNGSKTVAPSLVTNCIKVSIKVTGLDPFLGSGTTGVAALNTNRKFLGVEMEEKYFDIGASRMEGLVVMCVRHGCDLFYGVVDKIYPPEHEYWDWEQGFVTNKYRFVSREEAWIIAEKQGQIIRDHKVCVGTLYSEHLY